MNVGSPKSVVVVGGGIIGLFCAHYLRRAGAHVTILERDRPGAGCSWGNLGWVCPSIAVPLPSPGIGVSSLLSTLAADSPLYVKPTALPRLAPWLIRFRRHCNARDFDAGCAALAALNGRTMELYDELRADGVDFEYASAGLTFVSTKRSSLDAERDDIEAVGVSEVESWTPDELCAREPALPRVFAGALHVASDRHVKGDTVCAGVAARLVADGGCIEESFDVRRVRVESGRAVAVEGLGGTLDADAVVLATGAEAGRLAAGIGCPLPIQAGKGYSLSVHEPEVRLNSPLYLCDAKVGMTPYEGVLRVGGTMELSGINRTFDRRRVDSIRRMVSSLIPRAFDGADVEEWVGMRPLTPDGLPVIGRLPDLTNVFVASGHQMLGVTLAPSTGHALAELVLRGKSDTDLSPFDPGRF
ncbi:MAG: NAD(P)/FAD-dependent oxidoreductase [Gemmatimonadota bacterium]